jgi:5,10-methylene-tetrahydrofolate dehydrogenase/methenyl tetrahydrofolate cyclohydrolase
MPATILDGRKIAAKIKEQVARQVRALADAGIRPGLAIFMVNTIKACTLRRGSAVTAAVAAILPGERCPC